MQLPVKPRYHATALPRHSYYSDRHYSKQETRQRRRRSLASASSHRALGMGHWVLGLLAIAQLPSLAREVKAIASCGVEHRHSFLSDFRKSRCSLSIYETR